MSDPRDRQPDEAPIDAPELPSLPDGGLGANMPAWLRRAPSFAAAPVDPAPPPPVPAFDPASLTRGLELPEWLGELSDRVTSAPVETKLAPRPDLTIEPAEPETVVDIPPVVEPPIVETPRPAPVPVPPVVAEIQQRAEPVVEPPYRAIATVVIVMAAALLFIALWSVFA